MCQCQLVLKIYYDLYKQQNHQDFHLKNLKKLTQGLDFNLTWVKFLGQLLDPKNFLKILVYWSWPVIDVLVKSSAKYIGSILPYDEDFESLAFIGLIDPDRIHQLTAGKILNLSKEKEGKQSKDLKEILNHQMISLDWDRKKERWQVQY